MRDSRGYTVEAATRHKTATCEQCGKLGSVSYGALHGYLALGSHGAVERHTACDACASAAETRGWIRESPRLGEWSVELELPEPLAAPAGNGASTPGDGIPIGGSGARASAPEPPRATRSIALRCAVCARGDRDLGPYLAVVDGGVERHDVCARCRERAVGLGWMPEAPQLATKVLELDRAVPIPSRLLPPVQARPVRPRRRVVGAVARMLGSILVTTGVLGLADVVITVAWQEPITAVLASIEQGKLSQQVEALERRARVSPAENFDQPNQVSLVAAAMREDLETGDPIGRLSIEEIGIDFALVEDAGSDASLRKAPARYSQTYLPGEARTMGVAGHRTTYSAPFNDIDALEKGDEIVIDMPYGEFTYGVQQTEIVDPEDVSVLDDGRREKIVLTACHPLYSAAQRIVVTGILEDSELDRPGVAN